MYLLSGRRMPLDFSHVIYGPPGDVVEGWPVRLVLQYVRGSGDQLERKASPVPSFPQRPQDFFEIYVSEAWGEAVGVGEVYVVQEVCEVADGS